MSKEDRKIQKDYAEYIVSDEEFKAKDDSEPLKPKTDRFRQVDMVKKKQKEGTIDPDNYVRIQLSPKGTIFGGQIDLFVKTGFHPAIVQFEGYTIYPNHTAVTKYYPNRSLQHLLYSGKKASKWNGTMKSICVFGLISAVTHIHNINDTRIEDFSIRYLCPENIIFDADNQPRLIHYVFGNEKLGKTKNAYIPPELHEDPKAERFNEDTWAIGMILYEILTGHEAWADEEEEEIKTKIMNGELPKFPKSEQTDHMVGIIQNCLDKNPINRPLPYMIFHHLNTTTDNLFPDTNNFVYDNYRNKVSELTFESDEFLSYKEYVDGGTKVGREDLFDKAEAGDLYAMTKVGMIYMKGDDSHEKDVEKGFKYFMKASKKNYPIGMFNASVCLLKGIGCKKDLEKSFQLMEKAANQDLERAVSEYGIMFRDGIGTEKDVKKALEIFQEGADKGYRNCQYFLALLYLNGSPPDVKKNVKKAITLFERAASLGYAQANVELALHYYQQGKDDDDDEKIERAINLFKKAANQKSPEALLNLAKIYKAGKLVKKDEKYAVDCYRRAAEMNNAEGMMQYGFCLSNAIGVEKDVKKAMKFYKQAADKGHKIAQHNYAKILYEGSEGIKKDVKNAAKYFKLSADQNIAKSMLFYAKILINGEGGVKKNMTEGKKYLKKYIDKTPKENWLPETLNLIRTSKLVVDDDDDDDDDDEREDDD